MNGLSVRLDQTTKLLDVQQSKLTQAGAVVATASTSLSNAAGNVEKASSPLAGAVNAIRTAMTQVAEASKQLRDTSASEQQVANLLNGTVSSAGRAFAEHAQKFDALQIGVRETMVGLVNGVSQLAGEITKCIEVYDLEIAKSIGGLENAILDIADVVETRPRDERRAVHG